MKDNKDYEDEDWKKETAKPAASIVKPWTDRRKMEYDYGHDPIKCLPVLCLTWCIHRILLVT